MLLELSGEIISIDSFKGGYPKGEWNALSSTHYLVRKERTLYGFINHSLTPNAEIKMGKLVVITKQKVKKNEEITIDYTQENLSKSYLNGHGSTYLFGDKK